MDKNATELNNGNDESGEYQVEAICDSSVYAKELEEYLSGLYYLVFWKGYLKKENTWKPYLAVEQLKKVIYLFHKHYPDKPITVFEAIDILYPVARPTIKSAAKSAIKPANQKQDWPANNSNKRAKKSWI